MKNEIDRWKAISFILLGIGCMLGVIFLTAKGYGGTTDKFRVEGSIMSSGEFSYSYFSTQQKTDWFDWGTSFEMGAISDKSIIKELKFNSNVWLLDQKKIQLPLFLRIDYTNDMTSVESPTTACDIAFRRIIIPWDKEATFKKAWRVDVGCGALWNENVYFEVYVNNTGQIEFELFGVFIRIYNETKINVPVGSLMEANNTAQVELMNAIFARINILLTHINPLVGKDWQCPTTRLGLSCEF